MLLIKGEYERENCYKPIINQFIKMFPSNRNKNNEIIKVLVPGAGLGRLVFELCKYGFSAQGNEFSYFMLIASNFILNNSTKAEEFKIIPYIHTYSNLIDESLAFKEILIPDIHLAKELNNTEGDMSMVAGEFVEVYKNKPNAWDSVVTCFFIDTAHNIIEYIDTIHKILVDDGVWINFGPLLYHYTDMINEVSIELSWNELKLIITEKYNFKIVYEEIVECTYASDKDSMLTTVYKCIFFTAIKINE